MYTIGVIDLPNLKWKKDHYLEKLCRKNFIPTLINNEEKFDNLLHQMDIFLIEDDELTRNVSGVCELIIKIKSQTDALIWICQQTQDRSSRFVYLQLGADGNVAENCLPEELELILLNAMRRKNIRIETQEQGPILTKEKRFFEINEANMSVLIEGKKAELTKREFCTIQFLSKNPGTAFSYEEIYCNVWNGPYNNQKYKVTNVIFRIREKLEGNTREPIYIRTVRSKGYMLDI